MSGRFDGLVDHDRRGQNAFNSSKSDRGGKRGGRDVVNIPTRHEKGNKGGSSNTTSAATKQNVWNKENLSVRQVPGVNRESQASHVRPQQRKADTFNAHQMRVLFHERTKEVQEALRTTKPLEDNLNVFLSSSKTLEARARDTHATASLAAVLDLQQQPNLLHRLSAIKQRKQDV